MEDKKTVIGLRGEIILSATESPKIGIEFPFAYIMEFVENNPDVLVGKGENGADLTPEQYASELLSLFADTLRGPSKGQGEV
jgi:hypothetical protein